MKAWEVLKALDEGKKVTNLNWIQGNYWYLKDGKLYSVSPEREDRPQYNVTDLFEYGEWEEYVEPLKVGDWVTFRNTYPSNTWTFKINEIRKGGYVDEEENEVADLIIPDVKRKQGSVGYSFNGCTKATDEEINEETERRKWYSIGRERNEFKVGDIVKYDGKAGHIIGVEGELISIKESLYTYYDNEIELICPVESRFDN